MDSDRSKKIAGTIFVVVLMLVGVLVGTVITRNLSTSQNTKTSASQAAVETLEVLSPAPGQTVGSVTEVKARVSSNVEVKNLTAVFKVGEAAAVPMKIERQADKVILTGSLDPKSFPVGRAPLSIYLYQSVEGTTDLIGSSVFYIQL